MSKAKSFNIVGAGFSGLIQAFYLLEAGFSVHVHEKEDQVGGLLGSHSSGDFLVERAANALMASKELERIAKIIDVRLEPMKSKARKRYIYRDGEMRRWPLNLSESLPLFSFALKAKLFKKMPKFDGKESLSMWTEYTLGAAARDYLIEPAMQGVFASYSDELNAQAVFQSLFPSQLTGRLRGSVAPRGGMQTWIIKMRNYLKDQGCRFTLGQSVNEPMDLANLIMAVDLKELKSLANRLKLSYLPQSIFSTKMASLTSVTVLYKNPVSAPEGFGCLFPRKENFYSLGVLFNHNIFPGRASSGHSETWILNDSQKTFSEMSPSALQDYVLADRARLFSKSDKPDECYSYPWPERIPLYNSDLLEFNQNLELDPPPFLLIGNYLGQLGLSRILIRAQDNVAKIKAGFYE